MKSITAIADIHRLRESVEVECKLAQGRDGGGKLPHDVWESYCAFANTQGGDFFLGLKELEDGSFALAGIVNTDKVLNEFWFGLDDKNKVSANILDHDCVQVVSIDGVDIIQIHVPPAKPCQKPIFLGRNPLMGSYHRVNSSDVLMDEQQVRQLLAYRQLRLS
jgi:predicted HTH transcriptional regulator